MRGAKSPRRRVSLGNSPPGTLWVLSTGRSHHLYPIHLLNSINRLVATTRYVEQRMTNDCLSCKSISGEKRISPGPLIYEGEYWVVDHAYPCAMEGWLVIVARRHVEALHELVPEEFAELGWVLELTVGALNEYFQPEKEYMACFGEAKGFSHVHVHVIAKQGDLPAGLRGPRIFSMLKVDKEEAVAPERIDRLSRELQPYFLR